MNLSLDAVDIPTSEDLLGYERYADSLADKVLNNKSKSPLTIGVFGEWGSGKTSFLKMVEKSLKRKDVYPIWFNAWKYDQEDNILSALIQTIFEQVKINGGFIRRQIVRIKLWRNEFNLKNGFWHITQKVIVLILRIITVVFALIITLGWANTDIDNWLKTTAASLPYLKNTFLFQSFGTNIIKAISVLIAFLAINPDNLFKLFSVNLGIDFSKFQKTQNYRSHISFLDQFNKEFKELIELVGNGKPLIIFIDDLDRCMPDKAVQVLETIKLFLDVEGCYFVIAVDKDLIEKAILVKYKDLVGMESEGEDRKKMISSLGENYFEKIVQFPFSLPPIFDEDFRRFICGAYPNELINKCVDIFFTGLPRNPRKVKRLLQSFLYAVGVADKSGKQYSPSLIAKTIIIQYGYKKFYKSVIDNPLLMPTLERYFRWKIVEKPIDVKAEDEWIDQIQANLEVQNLVKEYRESFALQKLLNIELEEEDSFTEENIRFYLYYIKPVSPIVEEEKSSFEQDVQKEQPVFEQVIEGEEIKRPHLEPAPPGDLPVGSYLPFPRNPIFTGRESDLELLSKSLIGKNAKSTTIVNQAVIGMGGVGKTQLAIEFAYRYGRYFRGVHWLNLADPGMLNSEIAQCGMNMALKNWPEDQASQVALTLNTWKSDGPRLLVLDNFEDISHASTLLSILYHTNLRLLITSRRTDWSPILNLNQNMLDSFSEEESQVFFKRAMSGRDENSSDLKMLAERLGHLPLALELASRYLNRRPRLSINEYLNQAKEAFEHPSMRGFRTELPSSTAHDLDLQMIFAFSWQELTDENPKRILQTASYLAPNAPIPLEIFEKGLEISSEVCDESLYVLYGFGLLRKHDNELPAIHPLLAEYVRHLSKENNNIIVEKLALALASISNDAINSGLPIQFTPIEPHIVAFAAYAEVANSENAAVLWNNYGSYLTMIADYSRARNVLERALRITESNLGSDHPQIATSLSNLGNVLLDLGDLSGSKTVFERALKIDETAFGPDHPKVARDINNLGLVLRDLGDLAGARAALERSLKINEVAFGSDHPIVAQVTNNLGEVLLGLGDFAGARVAFERSLKINEAAFGLDHPLVARNIGNLGFVLEELDDLVGAQAAFKRSLKINEAMLGPDHPNVARDISNLGKVSFKQNNYTVAQSMFEQALKIDKAVFGQEHPTVARDIVNLGIVWHRTGELDKARDAFYGALQIFEKFFSPNHPEIKRLKGMLGEDKNN